MATPFAAQSTPNQDKVPNQDKTPNQYKTEAQRLLLAHVARTQESIRSIAKATGIPLFSLQKVQAGTTKTVKPETAAKLAKHLGVTVEVLTGRPAKPDAKSFPEQLSEALAPGKDAHRPSPAKAGTAAPALAGTATGKAAVPADAEVTIIPWRRLHRSEINPRRANNSAQARESLAELAASLREHGQLENIIVRPHPTKPEDFEIVGGDRRYLAFGLLIKDGVHTKDDGMSARIVRVDDRQARAIAIVENLQRVDLSPSEEGEAFKALTELGWETKDIAARIAKSLAYVQQRVTLVKRAAPELRAALDKGQIGFDAARTLASGGSPRQQAEIVAAIKAGDYRYRTADMIRTELTRALVPARFALFPATHYKGETREVDGETYFADRAQFDQLQDAAVADKQKELEAAGWSWVDQREFLHAGDYAPERSSDKRKAGCLIVYKHTGEVEIHEGLVSLVSKEGAVSRAGSGGLAGGTGSGAPSPNTGRPAADDYQRQLNAGEKFIAQLGDYVARRPALALRLYVFQGEQQRADIPAFGETRPATWPEIAAASEKQLGKIVLPQLGFNPHARADEAMLDLAKKAGVKIPVHMQPPQEKGAAGSPRGSDSLGVGGAAKAGRAQPRSARR